MGVNFQAQILLRNASTEINGIGIDSKGVKLKEFVSKRSLHLLTPFEHDQTPRRQTTPPSVTFNDE